MNSRKLIRYLERRHGLLFLGTTTLLCYYGLDITVEEEDDEEDQVRHKNKPSKHSKKAPSNVLAKAANKDKHAASTARGIPGKSARLTIRRRATITC